MKFAAFIALFICFLTSCDHRDSHPESNDVIYRDLLREFDLANKDLVAAEEEKALRELDLRGVIPQTGQIKTYEQKFFQAKNRVEKLSQQKQFFEIAIEQRKKLVQDRYAESFAPNGRPWPDKAEVEEFEQAQKLRREKIAYDRNKGIVKDVPRGTKESH